MTKQKIQIEQHDEKSTEKNLYDLLIKKTNQKIYKTKFDFMCSVTEKLGVERAFNTYDFCDVLKKVYLWRTKVPEIRPYYAVKTNPNPVLIRLLILLGFSFDCSSEGEMRLVLENGCEPDRIIFAHVIKSPGALCYASSKDVELMTFDSKSELIKIHKHYPKAKLLLRLIPVAVQCAFDLSEKFGCHAKDALEVLRFAKDLNLNVIGVSFHVGCMCKSPESFSASIRTSREIFEIARQLGFRFTTLDIGGGFSGHKGSEPLFSKLTEAVKQAMDEHFGDLSVEVIAEPGTFFACSASTLVTGIVGKKTLNSEAADFSNTGISRYYYINDGTYGSFFNNCELFQIYVKPLLDKKTLQQRVVHKSRLWGQTCCCEDDLGCYDIPDVHEGEFLVWENMGAYARAICSTFCGVPLPASRYVFVNNPSLPWDFLSNVDEVADFLSQACVLIEGENECQNRESCIINGIEGLSKNLNGTLTH